MDVYQSIRAHEPTPPLLYLDEPNTDANPSLQTSNLDVDFLMSTFSPCNFYQLLVNKIALLHFALLAQLPHLYHSQIAPNINVYVYQLTCFIFDFKSSFSAEKSS